jgi:FkbM family methyltransferase
LASNTITLQQGPDGNFRLPSVQLKRDGTPRFVLSLPPGYEQDPGLRILARLESQHAGFEYTTRAFFDAHLKPGDIFVDIGAHIGTYSLAAATLYPGALKVIAVEAHPLNAMTMMRQLALNGLQLDVELVSAAAGARSGLGKLWPYSTMGNFVSAERPADAPEDNPPLTVPIIPVDMLFAEREDIADGRIFLKVDVEGYEPEVIAGAEALLASGRVAAVVFEKSDFYATEERWSAFEGMIERFERHGYTIRWFPHVHIPCVLMPWVPGNEAGNLIAVAPGFVPQPYYDGPYAPYATRPPPMRPDGDDTDKAEFTARLMEHRASDGWRWADPYNMAEDAELRAELAAAHIPARSRILDLGAGLMSMALLLKAGSTYTPVDIIRYADATVLADLNDGQFPKGEWDCALTLELLEYIHDVPSLLARIRNVAGRLIFTYRCAEEGADPTPRRARGYFNDFHQEALLAMLDTAGWEIKKVERHEPYTLFVCSGEAA